MASQSPTNPTSSRKPPQAVPLEQRPAGTSVAKPLPGQPAMPPSSQPGGAPQQVAQQQALAAQAADAEALDDTEEGDEEEVPSGRGSRFILLAAVPSWAVSMVVHAVLLIVLALLSFGPDIEKVSNLLKVANTEADEEIEDFEIEQFEPIDVETMEVTTPTPVAAVATEVPPRPSEIV